MVCSKKRGICMKKYMRIACCALGSGMIGFFANRLDSLVGSVLFTLGIVLLVVSIAAMSKQK